MKASARASWRRLWIGLTLAALCGCEQPQVQRPAQTDTAQQPLPGSGDWASGNAPSSPTPGRVPIHLDHAQPKLPTINLWLGSEVLNTEVAVKPVELATGMMFRQSMGEDEGMLFVFPAPHRTGFYMKNTTVPLSAAYIDSESAIIEIHDLFPLDPTPVESRSSNIQYVLEVPQGWFDRHRIGIGTILRTELGSLDETFINPKEDY